MFEAKEVKNKNHWTVDQILENPPLTESFGYGQWQEKSGKEVIRIRIDEEGKPILFCQFIKYTLPVGKFFWYAPYGPVVIKNSKSLNDFFSEICRKILEEKGGVFLRIDPSPFDKAHDFFPNGFTYPNPGIKKISAMQPRFEWTLNIVKTPAELLAKMHEKTRYSIRLAEKKGVEIIVEDKDFEKYFADFYNLMKTTADRNKFALHPKKYYEDIFSYLQENGGGFIVIAKHQETALAVNLVCVFGATAYYLFGATSDEKKNLCAPYLAHWAAILRAKKGGIKVL